MALNGNLKNMKWLKENNCPWNKQTFYYAVRNDNLKNMKWLKKNNCPWDEWSFKWAVIKGIMKNMKWLKKTIVHGMKKHLHMLQKMVPLKT